MGTDVGNSELIREASLPAFFHQALTCAARAQKLDAGEPTLHYLTHLLSDYASVERLFDQTEDGITLRPLAVLYADALHAPSVHEQRLWLRRLGDLALFVGGLFAGRLSRRFTDLDYCIAMGGNAYGYLHQTANGSVRDRTLAEIYGELANDFGRFVELLAATTDKAVADNTDIVRLYERWQRTRSPRAARLLAKAGISLNTLCKVH